MVRPAIVLIFFFLLAWLAQAGTVVLSGGCISSNQSSNTLLFYLSNGGNDSAINVAIIPSLSGATPDRASYKIGSLPPQSNTTVPIGFTNVIENGTHAARIIVVYQQGASSFTAVFPCLFYYGHGNATVSQVLVSPYPGALENGTVKVDVVVTNLGPNYLQANVSLALPPGFNYVGASHYLVDLAPEGSAHVIFNASPPPQSSGGAYTSYGAAAFASYSSGNLSYTTMETFSINPVQPPPTAVAGYLLFQIALAAVVLIIALIAFSLFIRRRRHRRRS
jgi:hypothetical protein